MMFGYARTSTDDQRYGLEDQVERLRAAGCEDVRQEHVSGAAAVRQELDRLLGYMRRDDVLIVTKIDRLARNTLKLAEIVATLDKIGAGLKILDTPIDTTTAAGRMIFGVMGTLAQFEREQMLERTRIGVERAKAEGKMKGRPPMKEGKRKAILAAAADFSITHVEAAKRAGVSMPTFYRVLKQARPELSVAA